MAAIVDTRLPENVVIIGLVGGPGSGKGTQGKMLSQHHNIVHISIGEMMREEISRPDSPYAETIRQNMLTGKLGPPSTTAALLLDRMAAGANQGSRTFIVDGFPRKVEQVEYFERVVAPISCVIVMECPEQVMVERLKASDRAGRFDDTGEIIKKRIAVFQEQTGAVIEDFRALGKLLVVDADQAVEKVKGEIETGLEGLGILKCRE